MPSYIESYKVRVVVFMSSLIKLFKSRGLYITIVYASLDDAFLRCLKDAVLSKYKKYIHMYLPKYRRTFTHYYIHATQYMHRHAKRIVY